MNEFICSIAGMGRGIKRANMNFRVPSECIGIYPTPVADAFRAAIPSRWRAGFDRHPNFWTDKATGTVMFHVYNRRDKYITTIYCNLLKQEKAE